MAKKHFALMEQDHIQAKNQLRKELRKRIKEDFSQILVNDVKAVVAGIESVIRYYNELYSRCTPVHGHFEGRERWPDANPCFYVDGLFCIVFYEVKEVNHG